MTDYLDLLIKLIPVPDEPHYAYGSFTWAEVETAFGFPLPDDYKALVAAYGYGWFANYLVLYSPFEQDSPESFIKTITMFSNSIHKRVVESDPYSVPFDLYPYASLVPLGFTDDMGLVLWKNTTQGEVIVTIDADNSPNFGEYQKSLSQFLYEWVNGDFIPYDFDNAEEMPSKTSFTPL